MKTNVFSNLTTWAIENLDKNHFNGVWGCNPGRYVLRSECKMKKRRQTVDNSFELLCVCVCMKRSEKMRWKLTWNVGAEGGLFVLNENYSNILKI